MPRRDYTGNASLWQYDPMNEWRFPNYMNNHHINRRKGSWQLEALKVWRRLKRTCCLVENVPRQIFGEPALYLLLFEVSDYKRKAMKRTIAEQYICME
jgi:hypothetical protein